jgi:hypothetical protein
MFLWHFYRLSQLVAIRCFVFLSFAGTRSFKDRTKRATTEISLTVTIAIRIARQQAVAMKSSRLVKHATTEIPTTATSAAQIVL